MFKIWSGNDLSSFTLMLYFFFFPPVRNHSNVIFYPPKIVLH